MATLTTVGHKTIAEDVSDIVNDISPKETPLYSSLAKRKASNRRVEFLTYQLRATANSQGARNAVGEGAASADTALTTPARLYNHIQEFQGVVNVAEALRRQDTIGYKDEFAFQLTNEAAALKLEVEAEIVGNGASRPEGGTSTPGLMAGMESWITTNASHGTGGSTPGYNTGTGIVASPTDASGANQRVLTEDIFLTSAQAVAVAGGNPSDVICGAEMKRLISRFANGAVRNMDVRDHKLDATVSVIEGDFGIYKIKYHRQVRPSTVMIYDPKLWELATLGNAWSQEELPAAGTFHRKVIYGFFSLVALNEKGNAKIADLKKA